MRRGIGFRAGVGETRTVGEREVPCACVRWVMEVKQAMMDVGGLNSDTAPAPSPPPVGHAIQRKERGRQGEGAPLLSPSLPPILSRVRPKREESR